MAFLSTGFAKTNADFQTQEEATGPKIMELGINIPDHYFEF